MSCSTRPDGWSVTIQRLLRLNTFTPFRKSANPSSRHPTGKIWRSILAQSIFADLSLGITVGRRFIRLEYMGLSGVILYELPDAGHLEAGDPQSSKALTLQEVFGDDDDPEDLGMEVDHLLDRVGARLIYAPAYACTSFVVGQVMNALIHSHRMRPIATSHGIIVDATAFTLFDSFGGGPAAYTPKPRIDVLSYLKPADRVRRNNSPSLPLPFPKPFIFSNDPNDKDCELYNDHDHDQDQDQDADSSVSTIDSIGPYTPPHSRSGTPIIVASNELQSRLPFSSSIEPSLDDHVLSDSTNFFDTVLAASGIRADNRAVSQSGMVEKETRRVERIRGTL